MTAGWHLLAILARLDALAGREIQRVGLTATVGNPDWLLDWLVCGGAGEREVVLVSADGGSELDLTADWVASDDNAAKVIASLHHGEKRLVFADSRARVESIAAALRAQGTTVFVSHSSLSRDDRFQAERAFSETRDCVIVATSTLELGIDVGDLDRVIQIGAPATVASLLQRIGRTGRRAGTTRNCLFLATSEMELLQALALIRLVLDGWVEPLVAPPEPVNLVAQQLLARVLAEGRVGRSTWPGSFDAVRSQAQLDPAIPETVLDHMLSRSLLVEDSSIVAIGPTGEQEYGRRNFMDVTSLFLTEPLLAVRWGQRDLGYVDPSSLAAREDTRATILLGGRAWGVRDVDWNRRVVWVEPVDEPGKSRWSGAGRALVVGGLSGHSGRPLRRRSTGAPPEQPRRHEAGRAPRRVRLGASGRNDAVPRRRPLAVAVVDVRRRTRQPGARARARHSGRRDDGRRRPQHRPAERRPG